MENLGGYFKLHAYPGAKALNGQIGRSHYLTQPLPMFPPFPPFLILTLITACSNSRVSPFVWHCSKVVELFVKCVAMETNVCCHGDHVKSSFTSSLQTQEKRKRWQGGEILPWKTKCFEILANLTKKVTKIKVTFKPSTLTNSSHDAFQDATSFNDVLRTCIAQDFKVLNSIYAKSWIHF